MSAYNQNYSTYQNTPRNTRRQQWRWRIAEYGVNLTIENPELSEKNSKRITSKSISIIDITKYSSNLVINYNGEVNIPLGKYLRFPRDTKNLVKERRKKLKKLIKIYLLKKK